MKEEIKQDLYIVESIICIITQISIAACLLLILIKGFDKLDRYFDSHPTGVTSIEVVKEIETSVSHENLYRTTTTFTNHMTGKSGKSVMYSTDTWKWMAP